MANPTRSELTFGIATATMGLGLLLLALFPLAIPILGLTLLALVPLLLPLLVLLLVVGLIVVMARGLRAVGRGLRRLGGRRTPRSEEAMARVSSPAGAASG